MISGKTGFTAGGFYLGKFIYLLDAYEDIEEDIKKDRYNPIKPIYKEADFEKQWEQVLTRQYSGVYRGI